MKRALLASLLSSLALISARADLVWFEPFNYADGPIVSNSAGLWVKHSGTAVPSDSIVHNHKLEVSATGGGLSRQDDVHRDLGGTFTNSPTVLYASFLVNCTNLPPAVGAYFAHFYVNSSTFHGRVYAQAGTQPNTWRLGIAGAAGTVNKIFPADLASNANYQVVVQWDPVSLFSATLWVNPISSNDPNVISSDAVSTPAASTGYAFRQPSSFGSAFFAISNLAVATTFDEAATNVMATNAVPPVILLQPKGGTNFPGDTVTLTSLAAGQGLGNMNYQWLKGGAAFSNPNGNASVLTLSGVAISDSGDYQLVATTPYGLSATSAVASLLVSNSPVPAIILQQPPTNTSAFYHQSVTLQIRAIGPPTLTYQWFLNNTAISDNANFSGTTSDTLTISDLFTNNGTTGTYRIEITNPYGTTRSSNAVVTVSGPPAVSIAFLRTLVDPVNFIATNSTLRWQATGTITTFTNLTTGDTSSYYLQDGTAGINIFVTHGGDLVNNNAFRPPQGSKVTFVGFLSSFNSTLELEGDTNDLTTAFAINTNSNGTIITNSLPAPAVIPFNIVNNLAFCETNLEGRIVMLTNVFFGTNAGTVISSTANTTATVTNANGETFNLLFSSQDLDTVGQTLPSFAWSVIGVFNQNLGNAVTPRNQGYQVEVTRFADIVTNPPPPVTLTVARSGSTTTLTWPNVPWDNINYSYGSNYSYTVFAKTNITGTFVPLATGLTFTNTFFTNTAATTATYRDTNAAGALKFYKVATP